MTTETYRGPLVGARTGGTSLVLQSLIASDCVLRRVERIGGPRGVHSALAERSHYPMEIDDAMVTLALDHVDAVAAVRSAGLRRVLSLSMQTRNCRPVHTQRTLAATLKVPRSTLRRRLDEGLALVAIELAKREAVRMAA